jgi:hypothetical protein
MMQGCKIAASLLPPGEGQEVRIQIRAVLLFDPFTPTLSRRERESGGQ